MHDLIAWAASADALDVWMPASGAVIAALVCFFFSFRYLRKARMVENIPTSRIRSAAQGYVELEGVGRLIEGPVIVAPLTGIPCLWWTYKIERKVTTGHGRHRHTHWRTIASETSECLFHLDDDTGKCIIDPDGARVISVHRDRWRGLTSRPVGPPKDTWWNWMIGGDYRYSERRLAVNRPLYAMGWFTTQGGSAEAEDTAAEVREKLKTWKRDQASLLARFDRNLDGRIDMDEWEIARKAAEREAAAEQLARALEPGINVLRKPPRAHRRPYILSALPQVQLIRRFRIKAAALLAGFFVSGAFATLLIGARLA